MADILSQQEIDDLLNSSMSDDEITEEDTYEKVSQKLKIYSCKVCKNSRFSYPYNSPVIKKENIVFDPNPESVNLLNKVAVRTIDNYVKYLKNNKYFIIKGKIIHINMKKIH